MFEGPEGGHAIPNCRPVAALSRERAISELENRV